MKGVHRFFVPIQAIDQEKIIINGPDVKHIRQVLRLQEGDMLLVADGQGKEYLARIISVDPELVEALIVEEKENQSEPSLAVTLLQALPKGDKIEFIFQKCTELGVVRFVPVVSERCVVKLDGQKAARRKKRWQRIVVEAAKQSGRGRIPHVDNLHEYSQALAGLGGLTLLLWEGERSRGLKQVLKGLRPQPSVINILVGPEGGWTQVEVDKALDRGAIPVSLGPRILRTETAGLAAIAMVLYELGDLGGAAGE